MPGRPVPTNSAITFADGMAVRIPSAEALAIMQAGMERLVEVTDDEVAEAIRVLYTDTHTLAEGAGAAALRGADARARNACAASASPWSSRGRTSTGRGWRRCWRAARRAA